jgi:mRNA interferase RelE/StbE
MSDLEPYQLLISPDAKEDLKRLDKPAAERILKKMIWVARNAAILTHDALAGQWSGFFRWRIGDYRVIYSIDHDGKIIMVVVIGHRREVYEE